MAFHIFKWLSIYLFLFALSFSRFGDLLLASARFSFLQMDKMDFVFFWKTTAPFTTAPFTEPLNLLRTTVAPLCKAKEKTIFGVSGAEPVRIACEVEAEPAEDVTFQWALNNSRGELIPFNSHDAEHLRSIAHYSPRSSKLGYGDLFCWAKNSIGEQKNPCLFEVVAAGPPQPVHDCSVGNQTADSLIVRCEAGDDGGFEQEFVLEIYQASQLQRNISSSRLPVFEVQGGLPTSTFTIEVYARNEKGRSDMTALQVSTMPLPLPNKG